MTYSEGNTYCGHSHPDRPALTCGQHTNHQGDHRTIARIPIGNATVLVRGVYRIEWSNP